MNQSERKYQLFIAILQSFCNTFSFFSAQTYNLLKMRYTVDQRQFIVTEFFKNNENMNAVKPLFTQRFGIPPPKKENMMAMVTKWNDYGTVHNRIKGVSGRHVETTGPENIQIVENEFKQYPNQSINRASQIINISTASIHRILNRKLKWHPYKTQVKHDIPQRCVRPRVVEAGCLLDAIDNDPDLIDNIWFTDESHFELTPAVNKQNNRHWAPVQPHVIVSRPLHPEVVHVWGAVSSYGNKTFCDFSE